MQFRIIMKKTIGKKIIKEYQYLKRIFKKKKIKGILLMIIKSNTSSHQIALGAAIGAFFSIIPSFSIGMFVALLIAWKKKLNLFSTYLGTLLINPLTSPFVYLINYKVGNFILGNNSAATFPIKLYDIKQIIEQLYLGAIINATIVSILMYLAIYFIISKYRQAKRRK